MGATKVYGSRARGADGVDLSSVGVGTHLRACIKCIEGVRNNKGCGYAVGYTATGGGGYTHL